MAEALWQQLSYGKWRNLDFNLVAERSNLPTNKIHRITCALIAKGVIQQDKPGMYQQGWPNLSLRQEIGDPVEVDLELSLEDLVPA